MPTGSTTFDGDVFVRGTIYSSAQTYPAGSILDAAIASGANIGAAKLQFQRKIIYVNAASATSATAETKVVFICNAAAGATVVSFRAGCAVANIGAATVTVDLKKNGTTILSAPISLSSSQAAYAAVAAAFASTALVTDDVLEVVITATAGGGTLGKGLFAELIIKENYA